MDRERPLALYLFSKDNEQISLILDSVVCGGVTVNDVVMHVSGMEELPNVSNVCY